MMRTSARRVGRPVTEQVAAAAMTSVVAATARNSLTGSAGLMRAPDPPAARPSSSNVATFCAQLMY